jgi:hypothetical protein
LVIPAVAILIIVFALKPKEAFIRAKDAEKTASQHSLEMALDLYYVDNRKYPTSLDELVPNEISKLPKDAKTGEVFYTYELTESGKNYILCVNYELKETECVGADNNNSDFQNIYKPKISPFNQYNPSNTNIQ